MKPQNRNEKVQSDREELSLVCGRNSVEEALKTGENLDCLFLQKGEHGGALGRLAAIAGEKGIPVKEVNGQKLDFMTNHANHQGAVLTLSAAAYSSLEDAFHLAESRNEPPFFVLLDGLEDPITWVQSSVPLSAPEYTASSFPSGGAFRSLPLWPKPLAVPFLMFR